MGLLDSLDDPKMMGLLQAGLSVIANNGRGMSGGQALGYGLGQGVQGMQEAQQTAQRKLMLEQQMSMQNAQFEQSNQTFQLNKSKYENELAQQKREQDGIAAAKLKYPELAPMFDFDPKSAWKAANPSMSGADPYTDVIYDANGVGYLQNRRETDPSKVLQPVSLNGQPFVGAKWSPELGYNMARQQARGKGSNELTDKFPGVVTTETIGADSINQGNSPMPYQPPKQPPPRTQLRQPTPQGFPVISPPQQEQMDGKRKQILMEELQAEQQSLQSATDPAQQQAHQRNIQLLNNELGLARPLTAANQNGINGIKVPTKAEEAGAIETAKNDAEFNSPQAIKKREQAQAFKATTANTVIESIDGVLKRVDGWSAGQGGKIMKSMPFNNTAKDIGADVETIKANFGFDRLQAMRDMSPTGGALGQVAVQELTALQASVANLDTENQSPEQLKINLNKAKLHYSNWLKTIDGQDSDIMPQDAKIPSAPVKIKNNADYESLPSGTTFIDPFGKKRRKP